MDDLIVSLGPRRYRIERPWGRLPGHLRFRDISKLAVDSRGNLYVLQRSDPPLLVFDPAGDFLRSLGENEIADGHGIFITPDDRIFVVDRDAHQVLVFDTSGRVIGSLGQRHRPRFGEPFNHPTDAAVAPNGDVYVADGYGNTMVHRFSHDGRLIRSWGGRGSGPGRFTTPHGIWVLRDGRVLVGDRENDRVQIFSSDGRYEGEWADFYRPMDIYVDAGGLIYVTEQIPRLTVVRDDGSIVGSCKPCPTNNHGIRGDDRGNLYLIERRKTELTRLVPIND